MKLFVNYELNIHSSNWIFGNGVQFGYLLNSTLFNTEFGHGIGYSPSDGIRFGYCKIKNNRKKT